MDHTLELGDEIKSNDKAGTAEIVQPEKKEYEVVAESGIFKNGRQYEKGEKIFLTEQAANNFLASGDIK
jgi:hypothetical protein